MDNITVVKAGIVAGCVAISTALGWFGWLVVIFIGMMSLDWVTGSMAACKNGEWSSKRGREGLWHKAGCIIVVIVAGTFDFIVGIFISNIPSITLPFAYTVLLCPFAIGWYILTECGSIIENAGKMGAPVPKWLKKAISLFKASVDTSIDKIFQPPDKKA